MAGTGLLPPRPLPRSAVGLPQGGIPHPCLLHTLTSTKSPDVRCVSTAKKRVKMAGILSPQPPALHLMSRQLYPVKTNSFFFCLENVFFFSCMASNYLLYNHLIHMYIPGPHPGLLDSISSWGRFGVESAILTSPLIHSFIY